MDTIHRVWVRPACAEGSYGERCQSTCDCVAGTCHDGRTGDGACVCEPRFQGDDCSACSEGWSGATCSTAVAGGPNASPAKNCRELLEDFPDAPSGVYRLDPDGAGGAPPMLAYCDMDLTPGGWTLVLNYSHRAFTTPLSVPRAVLPLPGAHRLGVDETDTDAWGHANVDLMYLLSPLQLRFEASSSHHARKIHVYTSHAGCLQYAIGYPAVSCDGVQTSFGAYGNHNAALPGSATAFSSGEGDAAFTHNTFSDPANQRYWYVGREVVEGANTRVHWDVDDNARETAHTLHRVWVR